MNWVYWAEKDLVLNPNGDLVLPIGVQTSLDMSYWEPVKCTCGSAVTYGEDTPFHSTWCDRYVKP